MHFTVYYHTNEYIKYQTLDEYSLLKMSFEFNFLIMLKIQFISYIKKFLLELFFL